MIDFCQSLRAFASAAVPAGGDASDEGVAGSAALANGDKNLNNRIAAVITVQLEDFMFGPRGIPIDCFGRQTISSKRSAKRCSSHPTLNRRFLPGWLVDRVDVWTSNSSPLRPSFDARRACPLASFSKRRFAGQKHWALRSNARSSNARGQGSRPLRYSGFAKLEFL